MSAFHDVGAAAGVAVIHSVWQSTAIAVSAHWLLGTMAMRNSRARYFVGISALAAMIVLPLITTFRTAGTERAAAAAIAAPAAAPVAATVAFEIPQAASDGAPAIGSVPSAAAVPNGTMARALEALVVPLGIAWLVGVSLRLIFLMAAGLQIRRTIQRAHAVSDPKALAALREACRVARLSPGTVSLCAVDDDTGPAIVGVIRPTILVPRPLLTALSQEALRVLFVHELAHLKRHDLLVNLLLQLADAMLFFHPAARRLVALVESERERCCDDEVIAAGVTPDQYVATLVDVAGLARPVLRLAMSAVSGGDLVGRAERLLAPPPLPPSGWRVGLSRTGSVAACWVALALVMPVSLSSAPSGLEPTALTQRLAAIADTLSRERWVAFAIPLTTVPPSTDERPHSGWSALIASGAPTIGFRATRDRDERLVIALRLASGSSARIPNISQVAFRAAHDVAAVLSSSIEYLGEVTDRESARTLINLMAIAPAAERAELVAALALHADTSASSALAGAISRDPDSSVRIEALGWLRYRPAQQSVPLLRLALNDPDDGVWDEALTTLRRLGHPLADSAIAEIARTSSSSARRIEAAEALGR